LSRAAGLYVPALPGPGLRMNPRDILDVADALITGSKEAEWRSAVSRAYYAAFHVAAGLLRQCGVDGPRGEQAHAYPGLRPANAGHADVGTAGGDLNDLRKLRNWADYDLDQPLDHFTAFGHVRLADNLIQLLEGVPTVAKVQTQITDAVKVYERDVLKQAT